ncbi:hypothetical protein [Nesterenkonia sandarakina]|uniref:LPXTG-motif cell wall-anchored protein n=1 Tax=Nesterenkonia sandarakina TaxID=272918 RepID=A0A2T0YF06_9MICC|nr:hypothetical protein [Nesterenkonia sandarakina]PRZ13464.1 hypothetical protein BCL67_11568 [Nesterenkonia sandarakina]
MKKTFAKTLSAAGIVGFVALAPAPAFAYAPTETPDSITISIGAPTTVVFAPVFIAGEDVDITLTGINGNTQGLASVGAVSSTSVTKTADADGGVAAEVTLNSDAAGSYELTATGAEASETVVITVAGAAGTGAEGAGTGTDAANTGVNGAGTDTSGTDASATGADAASSGEELAATGPGSIGIIVGGAALLLVGGAVLVARSMRNTKSHA